MPRFLMDRRLYERLVKLYGSEAEADKIADALAQRTRSRRSALGCELPKLMKAGS